MAKSWMTRSEDVTKSRETFFSRMILNIVFVSGASPTHRYRLCFFLPQFVSKIITFGISPLKSPFFFALESFGRF